MSESDLYVIKVLPPKTFNTFTYDKIKNIVLAELKPVFDTNHLGWKGSKPKIFYDEENKKYFIIYMTAVGSKRHFDYDIINLRTGKVFHGFPEALYSNTPYLQIFKQKYPDLYEYINNGSLEGYHLSTQITYRIDERQTRTINYFTTPNYFHELAGVLFVEPSVHMIRAYIYNYIPSEYLIISKYSWCYGYRNIKGGSEVEAFYINGIDVQPIHSEKLPLDFETVLRRLPYQTRQEILSVLNQSTNLKES